MATGFKFTKVQRSIMSAIKDGMIIRKVGSGYHMYNVDGSYASKVSIAVKTLAKSWLIANTGEKIYFTSRGYSLWTSGIPSGSEAELVKLADARVAYVQSMMDSSQI